MNRTTHKSFQVIRGQRILDQLNRLDETSYSELYQNTMNFIPSSEKRQWATDPIQVNEMKLTPFEQSDSLQVECVVKSDDKEYQSIILFDRINYEEQDQGDNVTFVGTDDQEHHIEPIRLNESNVKVRCQCLDFRWRFAIYNAQDNSLYGDPPGPYQKQTDRPSVNQRNVPGVCKHLMKCVIALRDSGLIKN